MIGESQQAQTVQQKPPTRLSFGAVVGRSLRLRCPRCGGGRLFRSYFRMYADCPNCKLHYEREPGYFLGSTYINYGLTSILVTVFYVLAVFVGGYSNRQLLAPLLLFVVVFPMVFFRLSRSFWLGMDCFLDKTDLSRDEES